MKPNQPTRGARRVGGQFLGAGIGIVVAAALLLPWALSSVGTGTLPLLSGWVAARNAVTVAAGIVAVLTLTIGIWRPVRTVARGMAPFLVSAAIVLAIGWSPIVSAHVEVTPTAKVTRILSWNTNGSLVSAERIADEASLHLADIVVLPEISTDIVHALDALLAPQGYTRVQTLISSGAIFSRTPLRVDQPNTADPVRILTAHVTDDSFRIAAVHLPIPFLPKGNREWNEDVASLQTLCDSGPPTVIVGDFNATTDNLVALQRAGCSEVAGQFRSSNVGTWPTALPTWLAMPIDHVYLGGSPHPRAARYDVLNDTSDSGARHRPIEVDLVRTTL